ncbi:hypothetical protein PHET_07968 [Paragonimus heterotremus]|uniref:Uncharacterized protein n=1 Tax=Paragonimus heterotremus TaxID=100268 RepID=A0A8J4SXC0_9TREM|nr:hypothetical protein PHET_07968 [Paragonimus heterotremus]
MTCPVFTLPISDLAEYSVERTIASFKSSVIRSKLAEYDTPGSSYSHSSATLASDCGTRVTSGPRICELTEDEVSDIPSIDMLSAKLYDEVCSTQYTSPAVHTIPDSVYKRRWSSPLLPVQSAGRLYHFPYQLRLQSQQHSVPPSATEPITSHTSNSRWYIPPPSRRLLSQPLPPLPSVGPSGAESMAGTIDSSHASSSLTPEDEDDAASLHSANSVPDFTCLARSSTHHASKSSRRRVREPQRLHVLPTHHTPLSSPNMSWHVPEYGSRRRHSSLGSLDDHYQTPHSVPDDPLVDEYWGSKELQFRENSLISSAQTYCVDASTTTTSTVTHSGYTLVSEDDGSHVVAHSRDTSTTHVGFPSDLSLPCSEVADYDEIPWQSRLSPPSWPEDVGLTKSVNHAAARRSVSCVTDTKSFTGRLQSLDPRVVATLPARRECDLPSQTQTASDAVVFPITTETVLSTEATTSPSSNSSCTATSSGVALTATSFSSHSTPPFGSAGTTRPSSSAILWPPPPPTLTEEHEAFEVEDGENCRTTNDRIVAAELCVSANESKQQERSAAHEIEEPLESDTTSLPRSCPIRPQLRRANTATGSGGDDAKVPANVPTAGELNYSPNNASLILVATQLEEVQHGATKLRSRHQTLSFRLSSRLAREHRTSVADTLDHALKSHSKPENRTEASSHDPHRAENDAETTQEQTSEVDVEEQEGEEATASLCARLAAIEMLIEQAESMEARLRDEINHYMSSSSAGSTSVTRRINPSPPQQQFCNGCRQEVVCQSETTFSGYGSRMRGRYRRGDSNFSYTYKSTPEPNLLPRGRGRGRGRNRRGRHAGSGFTNGGSRSRGPMWPNKPVSSPGSCAVALSPAV